MQKVPSTPYEQNVLVYDSDKLVDDLKYREAVGSLVYAMVTTRPSFVITKTHPYRKRKMIDFLIK